MRRSTTALERLHTVPANRRTYPALANDTALTRVEVLAARKADVSPKRSVVLRAA